MAGGYLNFSSCVVAQPVHCHPLRSVDCGLSGFHGEGPIQRDDLITFV